MRPHPSAETLQLTLLWLFYQRYCFFLLFVIVKSFVPKSIVAVPAIADVAVRGWGNLVAVLKQTNQRLT
jgi:hypothetical protein